MTVSHSGSLTSLIAAYTTTIVPWHIDCDTPEPKTVKDTKTPTVDFVGLVGTEPTYALEEPEASPPPMVVAEAQLPTPALEIAESNEVFRVEENELEEDHIEMRIMGNEVLTFISLFRNPFHVRRYISGERHPNFEFALNPL